MYSRARNVLEKGQLCKNFIKQDQNALLKDWFNRPIRHKPTSVAAVNASIDVKSLLFIVAAMILSL